MMARPRQVATLALVAMGLGCGSNRPEVPNELLQSGSSCSAPGYPIDGFGSERGDLVRNACFQGFRAPTRVPPELENLETVAFSDYFDPAGTKQIELLLINTAAVWCSACISEHRTLPRHYQELGPRGLIILGTLFQDAARNPASFEDLQRWIRNFDTNFPMVADPEIQMSAYSSPDLAPLNLVVDARSMRILNKYVGDQAAVMWPFIESELARRESATEDQR